MPLKIIRESETQLVGRGPVLLAVLPVTGQSRDLYVGNIAEEVALLSKAHALISGGPKGNSTAEDLRQMISEFQANLESFLEGTRVECVLQIAGTNDPGIQLRPVVNGPQTDEILQLIRDRFGHKFNVRVEPSEHGSVAGNSGNMQTISIMLGPDARGFQKDSAIAIISDVVDQINGRLGNSESDEGVGDILD